MNRSIGILIIFLLALSSVNLIDAASPSKIKFSGDGSLTGHFYASTVYRADDGSNKNINIIDYATYGLHTSKSANIPNEAKYNDIYFTQTIVGTPKNCLIVLMNYNGGDISVDYDLPTSEICKENGGTLKVTYEGKTVKVHGGETGVWSR
jgi:hypothetical protein